MNECQAKPKGHRDFFGTFEQFQTAQNTNRKRELLSFLSTLSAEDRSTCLESLERDLVDLGIQIN